MYKEKDTYCAKIVSLTEPNWPAGSNRNSSHDPKNDRNNPNADLRSRPIIGMQIMQDFVYNAHKNISEGGRIYDPGCGKTYKCNVPWLPRISSKSAVTSAFHFWDELKLGRADCNNSGSRKNSCFRVPTPSSGSEFTRLFGKKFSQPTGTMLVMMPTVLNSSGAEGKFLAAVAGYCGDGQRHPAGLSPASAVVTLRPCLRWQSAAIRP